MAGSTRSGIPLADAYTAWDVASEPAEPGEPPFTRGITPAGYVDQLWVMGQYGGFASATETNRRLRELLREGQTGFSIALDLPTQLGLDSDDPRARGEVGRVGVPIDSLADLEVLFEGIELSEVRQIRTTANSIGPWWVAMMSAFAERRGLDPNDFGILIQNDVLKEYVARGTQIFPPAVGLRLSADVIEHTALHLPNWTPIAVSGYHLRETGATAVQELSITLANTIAYLDEVVARGVPIDSVASKIYMFLSAGMDLLEEVSKFRAARTVWATLMAERYGAKVDSQALRIFAYTSGLALTAQSPQNNIVRVTMEALAAVCGGVQTLNTSSYDEALGTPTLDSVRLALRTQQILAEETSLAQVADPLGGSYVIESLTAEIRRLVDLDLERITAAGGALACIESGLIADELADQAYADQVRVDAGERRIVGVNCYRDEASGVEVPAFSVDPHVEAEQVSRLDDVRQRRDERAVEAALERVREAARAGESSIPTLIGAVQCYATIGEIHDVLRSVHGVHNPDRA